VKTITIGAIHPLHADTDGRLQPDRTRDSPHKGSEIAIVHRVVTSGKKSDRRQYGATYQELFPSRTSRLCSVCWTTIYSRGTVWGCLCWHPIQDEWGMSHSANHLNTSDIVGGVGVIHREEILTKL